jgi:CrcB protein
MWQKLLILSLGGATGTLARYGLSGLTNRWLGGDFPWGTFAVNALGCLLFGMIAAMADGRITISAEARLLILTGFIGAFTTYSTFAFESSQMLRESQWLLVAANVVGQNVVGLLLVLAGLKLGHWI